MSVGLCVGLCLCLYLCLCLCLCLCIRNGGPWFQGITREQIKDWPNHKKWCQRNKTWRSATSTIIEYLCFFNLTIPLLCLPSNHKLSRIAMLNWQEASAVKTIYRDCRSVMLSRLFQWHARLSSWNFLPYQFKHNGRREDNTASFSFFLASIFFL